MKREALSEAANAVWSLVGGPATEAQKDVRSRVLASVASYLSCLASEGFFVEETLSGLRNSLIAELGTKEGDAAVLIQEDLYCTGVTWIYRRMRRVAREVIAVEICRDPRDEHSFADVSVWRSEGWSLVLSRPIEHLACRAAVWPTVTSADRALFEVDANALEASALLVVGES